MKNFIIDSAVNDILIAGDGEQYIDFFSGYGSVLVGHANTAVNEQLKNQIDRLWITGKNHHRQRDQTYQLIQSFMSDEYSVAQIY